MKSGHLLSYLLFLFITSACIRNEAPNAEADILSCSVPGVSLTTSPIIQNETVTLLVPIDTDLAAMAPEFTLTPGASIEPPSGTVRNFLTPQTYTVTSEDGEWHKTYTVYVIDNELKTVYNFEDTVGGQKYYVFAEKENGKVVMEWASGNAGFALTGVPKTADDYPTLQVNEGKSGKCLKLVTRSTGSFGSLMKMPIAAGNLFIGSFDVLSALASPLAATRFGLPFPMCLPTSPATINTVPATFTPRAESPSATSVIYATFTLSSTKQTSGFTRWTEATPLPAPT